MRILYLNYIEGLGIIFTQLNFSFSSLLISINLSKSINPLILASFTSWHVGLILDFYIYIYPQCFLIANLQNKLDLCELVCTQLISS